MLLLAGGFETQVQSVLHDTPKAMAPVGGIPFLALQLKNWLSQYVRSFVFCSVQESASHMEIES